MRFGYLLKKLAIPEWRLCYISYDLLKALIDIIKRADHIKDRQRLTLSVSDLRLLDDIVLATNKTFFRLIREEVFLTFAFVQRKLMELADSKAQFEIILESIAIGNETFLSSLENLHMEMCYLNDLVKVNLEGERKILKKHKKVVKKLKLPSVDKLGGTIERLSLAIQELKDHTQEMYVTKSPLDSKEARVNIRELTKFQTKSVATSFLFGMGVGIAVSIIGVMIALTAYAGISIGSDLYFIRDFPVFRGLGLLLIYLWLFALNIYTFQRKHINYKLIFNITSSETSVQIFYRNSLITSVYLVLFLIWVIQRVTEYKIGMAYLGGAAWLVLLTYFVMPAPNMSWRGRFYMLTLIFKSLASPITGVTFANSWFSGQMASLITSWKDLAYTICYYSILDLSPDAEITQKNQCNAKSNIYVVFLVGMFVYIFRCLQCVRQGIQTGDYFCSQYFLNTIKYFLSLVTLTLSFLYNSATPQIFPLWCVSSIISTCYSYVWDIKMNWGLLTKNSKNLLLRDDLVYGPPALYYVAMVANFFLRLSWVFTISPSIVASFHVSTVVFTLITGSLQVFRRTMWNLFRVQRQHIANCVKLKATKEVQAIKLLKLHEETQINIQMNDMGDDRQAIQQRQGKLKSHLYKLIEKKKKTVEELQTLIKGYNKELKAIYNKSLH